MSVSVRSVRRLAATLTAAALVVGLAACSKDDDGGDQPSDDAASPTKTYDPDKPIEPKFDVPDGFVENTDAELPKPLSDNYTLRLFAMQGVETDETVFIASYVIDTDTTDLSKEDLIKLVGDFDEQIGNKDDGKAYTSLANGRSGVHKYILEPLEEGSGEHLKYNAEFFFEGNHLVEVGCQFEDEPDKVETACQTVLQNLEF